MCRKSLCLHRPENKLLNQFVGMGTRQPHGHPYISKSRNISPNAGWYKKKKTPRVGRGFKYFTKGFVVSIGFYIGNLLLFTGTGLRIFHLCIGRTVFKGLDLFFGYWMAVDG